MDGTLLALYRHKTWATLALIDFCAGLSDAQLDATTPGTYGSIRDTFHHLVRAEESYFARVTGRRLSEPLGKGQVSLDELARRIRVLGPEWEKLAEDPAAQARIVTTDDGWRMAAALIMAQAVHHADDHRTHVASVLGALHVDGPELDLWSYADATGKVEHVPVTQAEK
ncbi:MAG TPA: DinB family protein [Candidatus Limnocylindrales bacterium]|nr:DinB family protein [Candidatus Limnocylindrales bacterium]